MGVFKATDTTEGILPANRWMNIFSLLSIVLASCVHHISQQRVHVNIEVT